MLKRAKKRGEHPPKVLQVLDEILGPLYFRALFGTGPLNEAYAKKLVARLLARESDSP